MVRAIGELLKAWWAVIKLYIKIKVMDYHAKKRGEVRIAPGTKGRIYARIADLEAKGGSLGASTGRVGTLTMRITRKDGTVDTHKAHNVTIVDN